MCLYFLGLWKWGHIHLRSTFSIHMGENLILYKLKVDSLKVKATICSKSYMHFLYLVKNKL